VNSNLVKLLVSGSALVTKCIVCSPFGGSGWTRGPETCGNQVLLKMPAATTSLACQIVRVKVLAMKSFQLLP